MPPVAHYFEEHEPNDDRAVLANQKSIMMRWGVIRAVGKWILNCNVHSGDIRWGAICYIEIMCKYVICSVLVCNAQCLDFLVNIHIQVQTILSTLLVRLGRFPIPLQNHPKLLMNYKLIAIPIGVQIENPHKIFWVQMLLSSTLGLWAQYEWVSLDLLLLFRGGHYLTIVTTTTGASLLPNSPARTQKPDNLGHLHMRKRSWVPFTYSSTIPLGIPRGSL